MELFFVCRHCFNPVSKEILGVYKRKQNAEIYCDKLNDRSQYKEYYIIPISVQTDIKERKNKWKIT